PQPRTAAAGQNIARQCARGRRRQGLHTKMITLGLLEIAPIRARRANNLRKVQNILPVLCFKLVIAFMGVLAYASPPDRPQHFTSVVRADSRSGKLVRSLVVVGRPVATA